jgi:predicted alpha/beta-fold hydrolase
MGPHEIMILTLAQRGGFYAKTIARVCTKAGFATTDRDVYAVCRENGVKLRAYRQGKTKEAKARIEELAKKRATTRPLRKVG